MSTTVDNRVVSMQFDNKNFERNVQTSLSTLDKLKRSLNLKGAAKSFDSIDTSVKKVNIAPLSNAVETVKLKFSALEVMAVTALANITNSAVNAGKRLVSAFTIDPIKSGFQEYETQINAIQTILANTESKGTTLDDVNNALDTLNKYADKTIYNFTEMTRNIGTFTAAGIDLETSVTAIQGIANLAAVSGSTSQQASTAMYQLSQALASGTVKLMDWNSVVNAGMGGQVFQDALKETARVHGIAIDEMIKDEGSFRETLSKGWLTSEILTETLQKFTLTTEGLTDAQIEQNKAMLKSKGYSDEQIENIFKLGETATDAATKVKTFTQLMDTLKEAAQSGWTETWEILVGDFDEAKELWTKISDTFGEMIGKSADKRNKFLSKVFSGSTWDELVEKLNDAGVETKDFNAVLTETLKENGINVDTLVDKYGSLENAFKKGAVSSKYLKEALKNLNTTSKETLDFSGTEDFLKKNGVMQFGVRKDSVNEVEKALKQLGYNLTGKDGINYAEDGFYGTLTRDAIKAFQKDKGLKITGIVDEKTLAALKEATATTKALDESIWGLIDGVDNLGGREVLIEALSNAFDALMSVINPIKEAFETVFSLTPEGVFKTLESFRDFTASLKLNEEQSAKLKTTFEGLFSILGIGLDAVKAVGGAIWGVVKKIFPMLSSGVLDIGAKLGEWAKNLRKTIQENEIFQKVIGAIGDAAGKVYEKLKEWYNQVKAFLGSDDVKKWFEEFKESIVDFAKVAWGKLKEFGKHFREFFEKLKAGDFSSVKEALLSFKDTIVNFFKGLNLKEGTGKALDSIKEFGDKIKKYFAGIGVDLDAIWEKFSGFFKGVKEWFTNNGGALIALGLLTAFFLGIRKLVKFVTSFTNPFGDIIDAFASLTKSVGKSIKAEALKTMAEAIAILAASVAVLALLPAGAMWSAVGAVVALGLVLAGLSFAMSKIGSTGDMAKLAGTILGISGALVVFALAAKAIGSMDADKLVKTGAVLAGLLVAIWLFSKGMSKVGAINVTGIASTILAMAGSLLILAIAVKKFGKLETSVLLKGGAAITVFLTEIVGIVALLGLISTKIGMRRNITKIGASIAGICASLLLLAVAVSVFGHMKTETLVKGGLAITIFLATMVGVIAIISKVGDLSANIGKVGLTMLGFAAALIAMAAAIAVLSMIDTGKLIKASLALASVMTIFAGMVAVSKFAGTGVSKTIYAMSIAVIALSVSLAALSFIPVDNLKKAVIALTTVIAALSLLTFTTKFIPAKSLANLLGMTLVISAVGGVLYLLGTLPAEKNITSIALTLGATMAGLAAMCAALGKLPATGSLKGALVAVGVLGIISAGIAAVITGFVKLAKWLSSDIIDIGTNLSLFMTELGPFIAGASKLKPSMIWGIVGLADMIMTLSKANLIDGISTWITKESALDRFGKQLVPFGENIKKFVSAFDGVKINPDQFTTIIESVSALADVSAKLPKDEVIVTPFFSYKSTSNLAKFGEFIATVGPSMADMARSLKAAKISTSDLKNLSSVCSAVGVLATAVGTLPTVTELDVLGGLVHYTKYPDISSFTKWIVGTNGENGIFSQLVTLASKVKQARLSASDLNNVKAICESVKYLGEAVGNAPELVEGRGIAGGPWGFIAGGFKSIPDLDGFTNWISTVNSQMVDMLGVLKNSNFKKSDFEGVKTICESVKYLGEAVGDTPNQIVGAGAGVGPWGFIIGGFASIPDLDGFANWIRTIIPQLEHLAATVGGLDLTKTEFEGISTILGAVVNLGTAVENTPGIKAGAAFFSAGPVIAAVAATEIPNISGFTDWINAVLPGMESLAATVDGLELKTVDYDGISNLLGSVKLLGEAVGSTPAIDIKAGLLMVGPVCAAVTTVEIPDLAGFSSWISAVLPGIASLATILDGLELKTTDYEGIAALLGSIKLLGEAVNSTPSVDIKNALLVIGPVVADVAMVSFPDLTGYANWIASAVESMSKMPAIVEKKDIDYNGISALCANVKTLAEAAKLVPTKEMGIALTGFGAGVYVSSADLTGFVDWIIPVMDALQKAAEKISNAEVAIDVSMVTSIANAGKVLAEMANALPEKSSWLWGAFETGGSGSWDDFGANVIGFGEIIKKLSESITGQIDESAVTTVATAGKLLAEMGDIIADGAIAYLTTEQITNFKARIEEFGAAMVAFSGIVDKIDIGAVNASSSAISTIAKTLKAISTEGIGTVDTSTFKTKAEELGSAVGKFNDAVAGVDIASAVTQVNTLIKTLGSLNGKTFDVKSFADSLGKASGKAVAEFVRGFKEADTKILPAISSMMARAKTAIISQGKTLSAATRSVAESAAKAFKTMSAYISAYDAGVYVVEGFASGISASTFIATAKATAMAEAALAAAKEALKINSPSKVFMKVGQSVPEGFAMGIDKLGSMVVDSSAAMADTALAGTKSAISRISDIVNSGIDSQPTIRPVVDLTDVASGASAIDGMLSMNPSIDTMAKVQGINAAMNNRQNGSNNDVISAIHDLGSKLGNMTGNTYNVNGVTYDDGSNISDAVKSLIRAARVERRV